MFICTNLFKPYINVYWDNPIGLKNVFFSTLSHGFRHGFPSQVSTEPPIEEVSIIAHDEGAGAVAKVSDMTPTQSRTAGVSPCVSIRFQTS